ncbi:hypothetical protein BH11PSE4_BH11PSE4_08920 [soil metagenome]
MKAGWLVALVYMLCVLAPAMSYALPGEHSVAHCLTTDGMSGSVHVHDEAAQPMHAHFDGGTNDHAVATSMLVADADKMASMSGHMDRDDMPAKKGPHTTSGQCCALMCVSALPASAFEVWVPSAPKVVHITTTYRATTDNAPAVHYRPPIS